MNEKNKIKIGKYLREKREKAQLTQKQVAIHFKYASAQFVSNWERGLIIPPLATIAELIKIYKMNKKEFIDFLVNEYELHVKHELRSS